jgi:TM2 domain-containing membrane protein YozV
MFLICLFLGWLGVDRFMLGSIKMGIVDILASIFILLYICWGLADGSLNIGRFWLVFVVAFCSWFRNLFSIRKDTQKENLGKFMKAVNTPTF